ncbi:hypothetical protein [Ereboglobus luteus]|uniref:Uncharacterized protein n=1 Tax=Ereboglobus luteus TaxID=1796921 RepID=A0A2U8E4W7_9BACT|nr:hypothetical protein [Ereboglobus luteus]AWI09860.1 hypothetical protein CKA38_11915 [Ereboglobus luteus]
MSNIFTFLCGLRKSAIRIIVAIVISLWLTGCASDGLRSYKRGKYYQSCEEAAKKLSKKPDNANAQTALAGAYPLARANTQRLIDSLNVSSDLDSYENVIMTCDRMNGIADSILRCPAALALVPAPSDYTDPRNAAAAIFVRRAYRAGVRASAVGTLEKSREAFNYFTRVVRYSPDYRRVRVRLEQARYDATMRVVVTRPQSSYPSIDGANYFYDRLLYQLPNANPVRYYTPEEAVRENIPYPHRIVELDYIAHADTRGRESVNTTDLVRNVAIGTTTAKDGSKQTILGDVKARYTKTRVEMHSEGKVELRIIDALSGRVIYQNAIFKNHTWVSETASFNGDARALDSKQLALTKKRPERRPSTDDMYETIADLLSKSVAFDISWEVDR